MVIGSAAPELPITDYLPGTNQMTDPNKSFQVTLLTPDGERRIAVGADEHIWDAAFGQGVELPALCHQGYCLTCAAKIESGEVDQSGSRGFFLADRQAGFALLCTGKPRSDLVLRTHQATNMRRYRLRKRLPAPFSVGLEP